MLCDKCHKREARIYYTEIVNGEKKEQYLCEECAAQYTSFQIDKSSPDGGLGSLLSSILSSYYGEKASAPAAAVKSVTCPVCGITYEEVLKAGKLGCADCYHVFGEIVERTLRQTQGADTHIGKTPKKLKKTAKKAVKKPVEKKEETKEEYMEKLAIKLQKAVDLEEFEEAARLRDEIRSLKKEAGKDA